MLRISSLEKKLATPDIYIADSSALNALDGAKFIPVPNINFGGRLVNELGKDLLKAASDGDVDEIRRLLGEGAPFTADWLGTSPLHLAAQGNHLEICDILLRAGVSTNARTKVDRTPLHMAAYEGHLNIVELFLMDDCEVDCTDLLGMTPLHWAAQNGHANVVQALLKAGADKNIANKFGLKPVDIAHQIDRLDIVEMIEEEQQEDPTKAAENLTIEMAAEDENQSRFEIPEPTEEVVEDVGTPQELDEVIEEIEATPNEHIHLDNSLSDSIKILQEHGITMLPNDDDNNILSTVMESGHSVVLTDVGKQVLDSVKASEEASDITKNLGKSNYITLTADEFLSLAANTSINKNQAQIFRQVNGKFVPKIIKRIVMKKNKLQTISPVPNILKQKSPSHHNQSIQVNQLKQNTATGTTNELEVVMKQLVEAKKTIEEYKLKLMQKEAEAERYKEQLNILMGCS